MLFYAVAVSEHVIRAHEMYAINMLTHVVEEGLS